MRKPLPILALLTLAAASSAQTFTLSPVATSGYSRILGNTGPFGYTLRDGLATSTTVTGGTGTIGQPVSGQTLVGWRAEFALPNAPQGSRLVSATFDSRATASSDDRSQFVALGAYAGSGTIVATHPASSSVDRIYAQRGTEASFGVTDRLGIGSYAGFDFYSDARGAGTTNELTWSAPTLTLIYAPVPEPSAFAALSIGAVAVLRRRARR